ncbi:SCO2583 family membrane protein [Streptomyces sp. SGAir0957]
MGGPGDPPEGTPEGGPAGGGGSEDEYGSVVFDESFVRAARLQEFSAQERISDHAPAVRRMPALRRGLTRQAVILVVLIVVAFGTAVYMGVRTPYRGTPSARDPEQLRMTVIPLAPGAKVPGAASARELYRHSPAARFGTAADGITLPPAGQRTAHFSDSQVVTALTTVKDYLVDSSLDPDVLTGGAVRPVRMLVDPGQLDQFDQSFDRPAMDGRHAATGWLIRFDPAEAELADPHIRVHGTLNAEETTAETLEVTSDHTFVYALRPVGAAVDDEAQASLFTVRRALHFRFDREDLRNHQTELLVSYVQAGPLSCSTDQSEHLHPLLAGDTAAQDGPAGTDPYATGSATALCGALAPSAQPSV